MNIMNIKKTLLILTIATTMCACKDNATTEPKPLDTFDLTWIGEDYALDVTYIGKDTIEITHKNWATLDWSEFDSIWAVDATLRNTNFTRLHEEYTSPEYDFRTKYFDKNVIKGNPATIKKIFNDLWEQHKKDVWCSYIRRNNVWEGGYYKGYGVFSISLRGGIENSYYIDIHLISHDFDNRNRTTNLNRKVRIEYYP
jgi:hypothetical protein